MSNSPKKRYLLIETDVGSLQFEILFETEEIYILRNQSIGPVSEHEFLHQIYRFKDDPKILEVDGKRPVIVKDNVVPFSPRMRR